MTHKETNILQLGLKCGLKRPINKFDVYVDVHRYMRKKYFLNKTSNPVGVNANSSVAVDSGLKNKSLFYSPNTAIHHLEVFKWLVLRDLEKIVNRKGANSRGQSETRNDVIVRPAEKGGSVVTLSKEFYINQLTEMLSDGETMVRSFW